MGQPSPARISEYDIHDLVQARVTFVGTDGQTPADASTISLLIRDASGGVSSYQYVGGVGGGSIGRATVGVYFKDVPVAPAAVGSWFYRWEATGGLIAADEWSFLVAPSIFAL
jgi:hypothetical protein